MAKTTAFVGSIATNYEKYLGPFLFEPYAIDLVSRLQDGSYGDILEIACGTGRVTAHIAKTLEFDTLVATDLNTDMIEVAKQKVKDKNVKWMQADAMNLPFDDGSFDLVIIQFGIMFFPDKQKGLTEAYRILRPGGRLIFSTWDRPESVPAIYSGRKIIESYFADDPPKFYDIPYSMYDQNELKELAEAAGFKNVKVELVKKEGVSPSAEELAMGIVEGNPVYLAITEKDPSLVNTIKDHVAKELLTKYGEPIKCPLQAWITEGIK